MVYELSITQLLHQAEELDAKGSSDPDLVEFEASARYYRMCAVANKYGIPPDHQAVLVAEKTYSAAIQKNQQIDFSSPSGRASRIMKAISQLEKALLE